jgi:ABC-type transporter Mla subunit MlaD
MTGEEMERAIEFLLKSQANLEARIEQVNSNLGARIDQTNRQVGVLAQQVGEYAGMQSTLVQVITRTFEEQDKINRRTDDKLNALIDTVNRMLSGGFGQNP